MDPVQIVKDLNLPRFKLEQFQTTYCNTITNTGAYSCLKVVLVFKREFSYYLLTIYVPSCMLVIVSWVSFWLDNRSVPARVALGVTTGGPMGSVGDLVRDTILGQARAEELGVDPDRIDVIVDTTRDLGFGQTTGSRGTLMAAGSVQRACEAAVAAGCAPDVDQCELGPMAKAPTRFLGLRLEQFHACLTDAPRRGR